jgi:hypothetical protein
MLYFSPIEFPIGRFVQPFVPPRVVSIHKHTMLA